ncbi:tetratricopeptide repeat protein [Lyngbya confervoides]|uniref:Tetratricopeptide repeat protein n=1 Tax=Lyngbya confervoides BDU141951 TaxID=1574623 RepID=A0ABD4T7Z7_9CYAN|nr:tetratricopeptide repeat protein [Lyngbya confervoides]MCM1984417.1 tetratricopeptide repeat protein [Lyngbya confervoides BDU141951]
MWQAIARLSIGFLCCLGLWLGGGQLPAQGTDSEALKALHQDLDQIYQQAFQATEAGDFGNAEALWTAAIERMPENPATWSNRGNARLSQFKLEEAIADFNQSIAIAPDQPGPYVNRGIAWEGKADWDRAIADYNHALELDPDDPVTLNNRGNAEGGQGHWEAAQADFERAANLRPGFAMPRINAALASYQLGQKHEALRQMKNLVRRYPMAADTRAALTAMLWDAGQRGEAESNWVSAVGLDPRYRDLDWVSHIRRWPPALVSALQRFLKLE